VSVAPREPADLVLEEVAITYRGAARALEGVSLRVPAGERVALLGANGAGKTTTVRSVSGMLSYYGGRVVEGRVRLGDRDITNAPSTETVRAGIAHVPEGRQMFPHLTVDESLQLGALTRKHRREIAEDMEMALDFFPKLASRRDSHCGLLSGGEQQMVAIARAIMARPRVFVIDELTLGLSPRVIEDIVERLLEVLDSMKASLLLVEQNAKLALDLCTYGYVLESGRVAVHGAREELLSDDRVREAYLGGAGGQGERQDREGMIH
jgi:branched-chain amino acid transport system ATP-binding protein